MVIGGAAFEPLFALPPTCPGRQIGQITQFSSLKAVDSFSLGGEPALRSPAASSSVGAHVPQRASLLVEHAAIKAARGAGAPSAAERRRRLVLGDGPTANRAAPQSPLG